MFLYVPSHFDISLDLDVEPQVRRRKIIEEDKKSGCGITSLRKQGYSTESILQATFPASVFWAFGFPAADLRAVSRPAAELKTGGYSCSELLAAGYAIEEVIEAGFDLVHLRLAKVMDGLLLDYWLNIGLLMVHFWLVTTLRLLIIGLRSAWHQFAISSRLAFY